MGFSPGAPPLGPERNYNHALHRQHLRLGEHEPNTLEQTAVCARSADYFALIAHGETIRILHTLTPLGVAMAGANEFDPYKD